MADLGYETLAVNTTAVALASVPSGATRAHIQCDTVAVRVRYDADPTDTVGLLIAANGSMTLKGQATLAGAKFILSTGSSSASLKVGYGTLNEGVESSMDAI